VEAYRDNMNTLKVFTIVWPDHDHVNSFGSKGTLYKHLDLIASLKTNTARLKWTRLTPGERIKSGGVLKRSHSDSGQHVLIPHRDEDKMNWEYLARHMSVPGCCWIRQSYSDSLKELGEWRVIIVGGEIYCVVHTVYSKSKRVWSAESVNGWYTLEELTCVFDFCWHFRHGAHATNHVERVRKIDLDKLIKQKKCAHNPTEGELHIRQKGRDEFYAFVKTTFDALYQIENRLIGGKSSIGIFCRMDIGVTKTKEGCVNYIVNEVERTPNASLWYQTKKVVNQVKIGTLGSTIARAFHVWLMDMAYP
jgi:hypothetical protein